MRNMQRGAVSEALTSCLSLVPLVMVFVVVASHGLLHAPRLHVTLLHASVSSHRLQVERGTQEGCCRTVRALLQCSSKIAPTSANPAGLGPTRNLSGCCQDSRFPRLVYGNLSSPNALPKITD